VTLQPVFSSAIKLAIVEFTYTDSANDYSFSKTVEMAAPAQPVSLHVPIVDRAQNQYQYRVTLLNTNDQQTQGSYVTASDPLVLVGAGS
jgi:hypothetical protein